MTKEVQKTFVNCKMWSIYTDADTLDYYVGTIRQFYYGEDVEERYDISKPFMMEDPIGGGIHEMYCITLIAQEDEANAISKTLGLINC